jgi:hypothetical protein
MALLTLNEFSNISREILESKLMEETYKMDISGAISSEKIREKFRPTMIPSTQDKKRLACIILPEETIPPPAFLYS